MDMDFYFDSTGELCFPTCLASLMAVLPNEVPNFYENKNSKEKAWELIKAWCLSYGVIIKYLSVQELRGRVPKGWSIAMGVSRAGTNHACLALDGKIVHDPWRVGNGLVSIKGYCVLI